MALSAKTINVVKATAPVVAEHALQITSTFYNRMFEHNPEVNVFFNKAHQVAGRQPRALADSVIQYALHIDDLGALGSLVERIAHRHCALSIKPEHYGIVHSNLMAAIGEVLGDAVTPEIGEGWSEAVLALAGVCIDAEEKLYQEAESKIGGWRYEREFKVSAKTPVADEAVKLTFTPTDGYTGNFEYNAGQYLTIRIPETDQAPRHYCLVSAPNTTNELAVAVRRDGHGIYSNYIHDQMKEGDKVLLGAPMGVWCNDDADDSNIAFVTGGIGTAPMLSFIDTYGDKVKAGVVVNRTPESTPFRQELEESSANLKFFETDTGAGRPDLNEQAQFLIDTAGQDAKFFVCGPDSLMAATIEALSAKGAQKIFTNIYGTGTLETNLEADQAAEAKCPFH